VRFSDVVENVNESERHPKAVGIERFIGLEHLEPGSLHIRAWGNVADGTTFTRRCRPGQVLFGKRRAYQRKVAVAEFDALVSGDIYVLTAKTDQLLPELLPFLCLSDPFFQFAVETSSGSLSPRTNWGHLEKFEFALPPLDQQRRIAEILWAVDEVVKTRKATEENVGRAIDVLRDETIYGSGRLPEWPTRRIAQITKLVTKGESPGWQGFEYVKTGVRFVTSENVHRDRLCAEPAKFIPNEFHKKLSRSAVEPQDVLVTLVGGSLGRACIMPEGLGPSNVNQAVAVVKTDYSQALPEYLLSGLQSPTGFSRLLAARVETFKANISLGTIRDFTIPVPPISFQNQFCRRLSALKDARLKAESALDASTGLARELVNQLLKGKL
jgi:type I restriction enzyme S subunit